MTTRADVGASRRQRARLRAGVEILALDARPSPSQPPVIGGKNAISRAPASRVGLHMRAVERGADGLRVLERVGVALAARRQPGDEIGDRRHLRRRSISSSALPMRSRTQAK